MTAPNPVELKPCPFCGGTADPEGWASHNEATDEFRHGPACDDCGASADSVEIWNRRAVLKPQPEELVRIARIVDPVIWAKIDAIMNGEKDGLIGSYTREQWVHACYFEERNASLAKADAIAALPEAPAELETD